MIVGGYKSRGNALRKKMFDTIDMKTTDTNINIILLKLSYTIQVSTHNITFEKHQDINHLYGNLFFCPSYPLAVSCMAQSRIF